MKVAVFFAGVFGMGMLALSASRLAAEPTLNYQGRLTAGGSNYTGPGYFTFMLHDGAGNRFWSNETVVVEVNHGLFNVDLGDTALAGMSRIPPVVFHEPHLWWSFAQNGGMVTPLCGHGKNVDEGGCDFRWERCFLGVHGKPFAPQGAT